MFSKAALIAMTALALCLPVHAQTFVAEDIKVTSGVFCDTQRQMERVVHLLGSTEMDDAIMITNQEAGDPVACVGQVLAYIPGPEIAVTQTWSEGIHILQVIIVGVMTKEGVQEIKPAPAYSIERIAERGA